jgi:type II secretory pathway pseudopilin PulG
MIITVVIVGILSSVALPSFTDTRDRAKSSNAKQFVVDAAKECSIAIIYDHIIPIVTQADSGSDVTLASYNCVENGSVVADGGKDRWTVVIDEDGIPEFPVKSLSPSI